VHSVPSWWPLHPQPPEGSGERDSTPDAKDRPWPGRFLRRYAGVEDD
jgi:hypothetical protein